jgi:thiamine pyrophosphokinase
MRTIIIANGLLPDPAAHSRLLRADDWVIAVDGGAAHAQAMGVLPHEVIGDMDSLPAALRATLQAAGTRFHTYPADKDETDLGAAEVLILGALGGRLDQTLANLFLLAHPALAGVDVRLVEGAQTAFLIRQQALIEGQPGDTVSLIPLGGDARGVTAEGLRWPLHGETLRLGATRGVSNVLLQEQARVTVEEGVLLCVVAGK